MDETANDREKLLEKATKMLGEVKEGETSRHEILSVNRALKETKAKPEEIGSTKDEMERLMIEYYRYEVIDDMEYLKRIIKEKSEKAKKGEFEGGSGPGPCDYHLRIASIRVNFKRGKFTPKEVGRIEKEIKELDKEVREIAIAFYLKRIRDIPERREEIKKMGEGYLGKLEDLLKANKSNFKKIGVDKKELRKCLK